MNEPGTKRFADPVLWGAVLVVALLFYLFVYPPILILLDATLNISGVGALSKAIEVTIVPQTWLYENISAYEAYLDFILNFF